MTDVRDAHPPDQVRAPGLHTAARRALATERRREMWAAVAAGLLGASLAAAAGSMTWLTAHILIIEGVAPVTVRLSGAAVQPGSAVLAAAALAAGAGVVATRRWGRVFPGLALLGVGLWVAVGGISVLADPRGTAADSEAVRQAGTQHLVILAVDAGAAPAIAVAGGALMSIAGLLVLARGWRWGSLGDRYRLPATSGSAPVVSAAGAAPTAGRDGGPPRLGSARSDSGAGSEGGAGSAGGADNAGVDSAGVDSAGGPGAQVAQAPVGVAGNAASDASPATAPDGTVGDQKRRARAGARLRGTAGDASDADAWRAIEDGEDPTQEP